MGTGSRRDRPVAMPPMPSTLVQPGAQLHLPAVLPPQIGDFHCGPARLHPGQRDGANLQATGIEFASEMVVKGGPGRPARDRGPTTLDKTAGGRPPHLPTPGGHGCGKPCAPAAVPGPRCCFLPGPAWPCSSRGLIPGALVAPNPSSRHRTFDWYNAGRRPPGPWRDRVPVRAFWLFPMCNNAGSEGFLGPRSQRSQRVLEKLTWNAGPDARRPIGSRAWRAIFSAAVLERPEFHQPPQLRALAAIMIPSVTR